MSYMNPGQVGPESSRPGSSRPVWGPRYGGRVVRLEGGVSVCLSVCLLIHT